MAYRWVVLTVVAVHLVQCNQQNSVDDFIPLVYEPSWLYRCVPEEGCQRTDHPQPTAAGTTNVTGQAFSSLDLCRTVCGRFGAIWPKPVTAALSMQTVPIHPNYLRFSMTNVPAEVRSLMVDMTKMVGPNLLAECGGNVTEMVETPVLIHINVRSTSLALDWNTDEEYMLDMQHKDGKISVQITSETVYGARHALETFTQLVASDRPDYSNLNKCGLQVVAGARIRDRPAYKHRGLLLDTSRNFIPMENIKRTIDGMAASKMNVFHWHVTDTQSFPLESSRVPQFTRYGAYSQNELYPTEEVRELIRYAQVRGVRVVIEIDSPAHAGNGWQWGQEYGLGDLAVCVNAKSWRSLCIEPPCGQLNPANPAMYRVLKDLYQDIADLLPQPPLLHMGGDEVFLPCWNSSQEIRNYMTGQGFDLTSEGFIKLWSEFHAKALESWDEILETNGKQLPVMLWSSDLTQPHRIQKYLNPQRYVIEVWEPVSSSLLIQLLRLGYQTVSVPKDIWYLDHGFWGVTKYSNWRRMYQHSLPKESGMLGGEVAMWSEYVDSQGLDTRVWPRAAAVAERLWSDPNSLNAVINAEPRLQRLRRRLLNRGLRPDAISPGWCEQHDSKCM